MRGLLPKPSRWHLLGDDGPTTTISRSEDGVDDETRGLCGNLSFRMSHVHGEPGNFLERGHLRTIYSERSV